MRLQKRVTFAMLSQLPRPDYSSPIGALQLAGLVVDTHTHRGVVVTLILELMPDGNGDLYPGSSLTLDRDSTFRQAEKNARAYVQQEEKLWQQQYDVRWWLRRRDSEPIGSLVGPSLGGALALGIAALLDARLLQELDCSGVAITAEVQTDGSLIPVGNVFEKLWAAHRIHTVVVAEKQEIDGLVKENEHVFIDPDTKLLIIKVKNVADAVRQLNEQAKPRRVVREHERTICKDLDILGTLVPIEKYYQVPSVVSDLIKETREGVRRFVVQGTAGSGKTSLVRYLAWRAGDAKQPLFGQDLVPARIWLPAWEAWATREQNPNYSLADYLEERYKDFKEAATREHWQRWLKRGEVLLLLDGLDEIAGTPAFMEGLRSALAPFNCPAPF